MSDDNTVPPGGDHDLDPVADPVPPAGTDAVQVNSQIVDAVRQTRSAVRIDANDASRVVDAGISYQKASQAAALAVQDAADYLRNVMTIASTAEGMALKLLIETKNEFYAEVLAKAQNAVSAAADNLKAVGKSATEVATNFPR